MEASPLRKTPRASSLSPAAHVRSRAVSHAYKVCGFSSLNCEPQTTCEAQPALLSGAVHRCGGPSRGAGSGPFRRQRGQRRGRYELSGDR